MPLQNRVQPSGDIIACSHRGRFMGNRGILHDDHKQLGKARWKHKAWIICLLDFKNRQRTIMAPNRYTELFFHDEAVAMAAGHRPCAECQRKRFNLFCDHWGKAHGSRLKAGEMDTILHKARVISHKRQQVTHQSNLTDLAQGVFISWNKHPHLIWQEQLYPYQEDGYSAPIPMPKNQTVEVLTPAPLVAVLQTGYRPEVIL